MLFALYGRVSFLCLSKEKVPKEKILDRLALRVPCDARMNRRDAELAALRQTNPELPGPSCASRRVWTRDWRSTPTQTNSYHLPSFRHGFSRNTFIFTTSGYRPTPAWHMNNKRACTKRNSRHRAGFDLVFDLTSPFVLSSTGSLERISARTVWVIASSAVPALGWNAQRSRRPTR